MRRLRSLTAQSPAIVISTAALIFSLGGGAYAATALAGSPSATQGSQAAAHGSASRQPAAAGVIAWRKLRLVNGWKPSQSQFNSGVPRYAVRDHVAYLSGSLHGGSRNKFTTLPRAARPNHSLFIEIYTNAASPGGLEIDPDGQMFFISGAGDAFDFASLAAISYPVTS